MLPDGFMYRNKHELSGKAASGNKRGREVVEVKTSGVVSAPSQNGNGELLVL